MKLYAHIVGDSFTILNEKDANNRLLKEPSAIMQEVERADNSMSGGANGYKLVNGFVIAKTQEELNIEQAIIDAEKARVDSKNLRDQLLKDCEVSYNGLIFQTRPDDLSNYNGRIEELSALPQGTQKKWILKNNSTTLVSKDDLNIVLAEGKIKCGQIWDDYINIIESL
jgi:hypothetical protein